MLEIGCGLGTDTINFARHGAQVTAVDLTEKSLELARQRAKVFGLEDRIRFIQANAEELSANGACGALRSGVLVWRDSPHAAAGERAGRNPQVRYCPGSTVKIMVYNRWSLEGALDPVRLRQVPILEAERADRGVLRSANGLSGDLQLLAGRQARRWLAEHGFRATDVTVDHIFPYRIPDYVQYRYKVVWYFRWMPKFAVPRPGARLRLAPLSDGEG